MAAITHAQVEAAGAGSLEVRWDMDNDTDVDIFLGKTPSPDEHRHARHVPAGTRWARVDGLEPGHRRYLSIRPVGPAAPVVVAERRLPFEGSRNFRDLGGYQTSFGTRTRWGRLFRSGALHHLTTADREAFGRLGVQVVFDLRGRAERDLEPDPMESVPLALLDWYSSSSALSVLKATTAEEAERICYEMYTGMLAQVASLFGQLLSDLGRPGRLPALFHCAGGKDRTGMAAALLLGLLGVDRRTILDDFELSTGALSPRDQLFAQALVAAGAAPAAAAAFLTAPRWAMSDALDWLDDQYGGTEAYLLGPAGMNEATVDDLRRALCA
jgi:protein-tyrosine phosphatase